MINKPGDRGVQENADVNQLGRIDEENIYRNLQLFLKAIEELSVEEILAAVDEAEAGQPTEFEVRLQQRDSRRQVEEALTGQVPGSGRTFRSEGDVVSFDRKKEMRRIEDTGDVAALRELVETERLQGLYEEQVDQCLMGS